MTPVTLLSYNIWANTLLGKQIESLPSEYFEKDFGGSFGSIKATLIHLLQSDWIWMNRFNGIPLAAVPDWQVSDARSVNATWTSIQAEALALVRTLAENGNAVIAFTTRAGKSYELPLNEIVTHISHHGSYHRGQLANMIRMTGEKPVSTDYFLFAVQ